MHPVVEEYLATMGIHIQVERFKGLAIVNLAEAADWLDIFNPFSLLLPYLNDYPSKNERGEIQVVLAKKNHFELKWIKPETPKYTDLQKRSEKIWISAVYFGHLVQTQGKAYLRDRATLDLYNQYGFTLIPNRREDLIEQMHSRGYHRSIPVVGHTYGSATLFHTANIWTNECSAYHSQDTKPAIALACLMLDNGNVLEILPRFPDRV